MSLDEAGIRRAVHAVRDPMSGGTVQERLAAIARATERLVPRRSLGAVVFDPSTFALPSPDRVYLENYSHEAMASYGAYYRHVDIIAQGMTVDSVHLTSRHLPDDRMGRDEFSADFMGRLTGFHYGLVYAARLPGGLMLQLGCHRPKSMGDYRPEDVRAWRVIAPEIARAAFDAVVAERVAGGPAVARPDEGMALLTRDGEVAWGDPTAGSLLARVGLAVLGPLTREVTRSRAAYERVVAAGHQRVRLSFHALPARDRVLVFARAIEPGSEAALGVAVLVAPLTARERQVVLLAGRGWTNGRIAADLGISRETVKRHVAEALRKTGSFDRLELIRRLGGRDGAAAT